MKKIFAYAFFIVFILPIIAGAADTLKVGDRLPDFKLPYATKDSIFMRGISNQDLMGKRYILAFYPAAWSGGCTGQMCTFRDNFAQFEDLGVEILAISGDYVFTEHEWARHHNLNFKLLADHTRDYGRKMGVYFEEYGMFQRSVFVVGPDGKFEYIDYDYSLEDDSDFKALMEFIRSVK